MEQLPVDCISQSAAAQTTVEDRDPITTAASPASTKPNGPKTLTCSVPVLSPKLRFPKPLGNSTLANWLSNSSPDILQPCSKTMSDTSDLGDSAFEIIGSNDTDTDTEYGRDSIASIINGPGEVVTMDDSDANNNDEDDDEDDDDDDEQGNGFREKLKASQPEHDSTIPREALVSTRQAEEVLETGLNARHPLFVKFSVARTASMAIEFEETSSGPTSGNISVCHTVRELSEQETVTITQALNRTEAPSNMVATIRQTMAQTCLSTKQPFRVLYSGSPARKEDILKKVSTAILSCTPPSRASEVIYNIVRVSQFLSCREPEVDIVETSPCQIKVQDFQRAEIISSDTYTITVDGTTYLSRPLAEGGHVVEPKYSHPHIAIFYCVETDGQFHIRQRDAAWRFMRRHGVPSIFISHAQDFAGFEPEEWEKKISAETVHLSLESRDCEGAVLQRLPIDLSSFMNIDARQMNRHLTYLTGSSQGKREEQANVEQKSVEEDVFSAMPCKSLKLPTLEQARRYVDGSDRWWTGVVATALLSLVAALLHPLAFCQAPGVARSDLARRQALTATATFSSQIFTASPAMSSLAVAATSSVVVRTAFTATTSLAAPSASDWALALSAVGLLSDKALVATSEAEPKKAACAAEIYSKNEVLIKLPAFRRKAWPPNIGKYHINVYRGQSLLQSNLSEADSGILVELNEHDAYGVLHVSVVTSRKPKLNETLAIDFGRPSLRDAVEAGMDTMYQLLDSSYKQVCRKMDQGLEKVHDARIAVGFLIVDAQEKLSRVVALAVQTKDVAKRSQQDVSIFVRDSQKTLSKQFQAFDQDVRTAVLKAQIASKLWWLRMQGKQEAHETYERKASMHMKTRQDDILRRREKSGPVKEHSRFKPWRSHKTLRRRSDEMTEKRWKLMG